MSVLSSSPENIRVFDMEIAQKLGNMNAAVIVQQLDYWMKKEGVGVVIENCKYVYNTFTEWVKSQFSWLSVWQFRMAMRLLRQLGIVKVVRYRSREWDQTNYYHLDYDRLYKFLGWKKPEVKKSNIAEKQAIKEAVKPEESKVNKQEITAVLAPKKASTEKIVNSKYKEHLKELDAAEVQINSTIKKIVKNYEAEEVERAIALFKTRKREEYILNREGYFVQVLKEGWASAAAIVNNSMDSADKATVFRYWYDLARELGYCSGQKVKEGEQSVDRKIIFNHTGDH